RRGRGPAPRPPPPEGPALDRPAFPGGGPEVPGAGVRQPAHLPGRAARLHDARSPHAEGGGGRGAEGPAHARPAGRPTRHAPPPAAQHTPPPRPPPPPPPGQAAPRGRRR